LITRLTRTRRHLIGTHAVTILTVLVGIIAIFLAAFQCNPPNPWDTSNSQSCSNIVSLRLLDSSHGRIEINRPQTARWIAVETLSILIELLLFTLSMFLVWNLSMPMKIKLMVCGAFLCRLLYVPTVSLNEAEACPVKLTSCSIVPPAILRLVAIRDAYHGSDATLDATYPAIFTQVVLHYSLIATTVPCMKKFLKQFDSGFGATTVMSDRYGEGSRAGNSHPDNYAMIGVPEKSQRGTRNTTHTSALDSHHELESEAPPLRLRPDNPDHITVIGTPGGRFQPTGTKSTESRSIDTESSDKAIIRKTQGFEIQYDYVQ
jgi:hypothetical protein